MWRHPDFLKFWSAQTISQFGTQISQLALPLAAVLVLDAGAFEVALLGTVEFLPFLLFALPAGVWVDRLRRRPILVLADVGRGLALATIPLVYAFDALTIWQLYVVGFVVGTLTVFFDVAYQSYLPSLVTREQLVDGNSKLEVSRSAAQLAGPGVAGVLVGWLSAPVAILFDAASFAGSAAFIFGIRRREPEPEKEEQRSMRRELGEGLRYLLGHRYWRPVAGTVAVSNFFGALAFSVFVVYAVRELGMSAAAIGLVFALGNVGWLLGALAATRLQEGLGVGKTVVGSTLVFAPGILLVALAPAGFPYPLLVAGLMVMGFGAVVFNVTVISFQQAVTPERMLGRLNASRRFIVWGVIPLGTTIGGVIGSKVGLQATLWVGAVGSALACLPVLLSPVRSIGRMDDAIREHAPAVAASPPDA
ncbi:MAG: MFS transporter [Gaiellales bacterium]